MKIVQNLPLNWLTM